MSKRTKRKTHRKGPSESATLFPKGTKKKGNDGNMWVITVTKKGVHRWSKYKSKNTPIKLSPERMARFIGSPDSIKIIDENKLSIKGKKYLIHDNGGRPFLVNINGKDVSIFKLPKSVGEDKDTTKSDYTELVKEYKGVKKVFIGKSVKPKDDTAYYAAWGKEFDGNTILIEIKDKFGKNKTKALILKPHSKFSNKYSCEKNLIYLFNQNSKTKSICDNQKVKYLKVFPTLNHLPISKTTDFSLLNNTYHQSLKLAPIVISSEENFVLILNINEFNVSKEDTISLKIISLEDSYKLAFENENSQQEFDQRDVKFGNNLEELNINLKRDNFFNKFLDNFYR